MFVINKFNHQQSLVKKYKLNKKTSFIKIGSKSPQRKSKKELKKRRRRRKEKNILCVYVEFLTVLFVMNIEAIKFNH